MQRASTRAHIIATAIPVFAELGPEAPVIDHFVRAAGISRGTFYNYFQTTRELLEAAMTSISDDLIALTVPLVAHLTNPVIRFSTAARIYHALVVSNTHLRGFAASASAVGVLGHARIRGDLREALAEGLIQIVDLDLAVALAEGVMVHSMKVPGARKGGDERARVVVGAMLRALGVAPALVVKALAPALPPLEDLRSSPRP